MSRLRDLPRWEEMRVMVERVSPEQRRTVLTNYLKAVQATDDFQAWSPEDQARVSETILPPEKSEIPSALGRGFVQGIAGIPRAIENYGKTGARLFGGNPKEMSTPFGAVADAISSLAPAGQAETLPGKVAEGIASAPGQIASIAPFATAFGPIGGFAISSAMQAGGEGATPTEMVKKGVVGGLTGAGLEATAGLPLALKALAGAGIGAGAATLEGGGAKERTSSAIVMGILSLLGKGRVKEAKKIADASGDQRVVEIVRPDRTPEEMQAELEAYIAEQQKAASDLQNRSDVQADQYLTEQQRQAGVTDRTDLDYEAEANRLKLRPVLQLVQKGDLKNAEKIALTTGDEGYVNIIRDGMRSVVETGRTPEEIAADLEAYARGQLEKSAETWRQTNDYLGVSPEEAAGVPLEEPLPVPQNVFPNTKEGRRASADLEAQRVAMDVADSLNQLRPPIREPGIYFMKETPPPVGEGAIKAPGESQPSKSPPSSNPRDLFATALSNVLKDTQITPEQASASMAMTDLWASAAVRAGLYADTAAWYRETVKGLRFIGDREAFIKELKDAGAQNADTVRIAAGAFDSYNRILYLFNNSSITALRHELWHAAKMNVPADMLPRVEEVLKTEAARLGTTPNELWAEWGERYDATAKAPTPELQGVFDKIAAWIKEFYQSVKATPAFSANIHPEIRAAMDRMYGGEQPGELATQTASPALNLKVEPKPWDQLTPEERAGLKPPDFRANVSKMAPENQEAVYNDVNANPEAWAKQRGVVPEEQTVALGQNMSQQTFDRLLANKDRLAAVTARAQMRMQELVQERARLVEQLRSAPPGEDTSALRGQLTNTTAELKQVNQWKEEIGRALEILSRQSNEKIKPYTYGKTPQTAEQLSIRDQLIKTIQKKNPDVEQSLLDAIENTDPSDLRRIRNLAVSAINPKVSDKLFEIWLNGILSGPPTHAANIIGNTTAIHLRVGERLLGGAFEALRTRNSRAVLPSIEAAKGFLPGWQAGLRAFMQGMREEQLLSGPKGEIELPSIKGRSGEIIRLPGRLLYAADQMSKAVLESMSMRELAAKQALREGAQDISARTQEILGEADQNPEKYADLWTKVHEEAKYGTFQSDLGPSGRALVKLRDATPGMKYVFPFVRTSLNILKFGAERSPVGFLKFLGKNRVKLNSAEGMEQLAKITIGTGIMGLTAGLFDSGFITGSGPTDPEENHAWQATGKVPYAIRIGDTWYSYKRIEPIGTHIGMVADLLEAKGENTKRDLLRKVMASISQNVTNKTYLQGLENLVNAISDPQRYGEQFLKGYASSVVPFSGALRQVSGAIDPTVRDTNIGTAFVAPIPGVSYALPAKTDVTGKEMQKTGPGFLRATVPVQMSEAKSAPLEEEFLKIGWTPAKPQRTVRYGGKSFDLNRDDLKAYNKAKIQASKIAEQLVQSSGWRNLPDDDVTREYKKKQLERIYRTYMDAARMQLIAKHYKEMK